MKIAVFGSKHHPIILTIITQMLQHFRNKDFSFVFEQGFYDYMRSKHIDLQQTMGFSGNDFTADLVLSFGGDGSFLKTASRVGAKQIPILGINTGRLGFLTDLSGKDIERLFQLVENQDYEIDQRTVIEVRTQDGKSFEFPFALNEVAVMKQDSSAMININASVNGELINSYRADGLIISTPTGSTAYSMSVGGPIVVPQAESLILSPISSHSLNVRPLIVPDTWELKLEIASRSKSYLVALDGRSQVLDNVVQLQIRKAPYKVLIAKEKGRTFFDTLKEKLMWGADTRN
ncbi:MAG: NAD kinase [Prevotellaceae bacterium]|jgi:NAD+ kinase|nr:NAD kinase [Prevotellaceae bacterium]